MKLVKSQENKVVFGVCGGVAENFGLDPALLRIGFAFCTVFGLGSPILLYLILAAILPRERFF